MYSSVTICMKDPANVVKNKLLQLHPSDSKFVTLDPKTNKLTMCKEISLIIIVFVKFIGTHSNPLIVRREGNLPRAGRTAWSLRSYPERLRGVSPDSGRRPRGAGGAFPRSAQAGFGGEPQVRHGSPVGSPARRSAFFSFR